MSEDYSGGLAEVKAQVESGNVTWDVVDVELSDALQGCDEGILEVIDPSTLPAAPDGTPATDDFMDGALQECAVGNIVWSTIVSPPPVLRKLPAPLNHLAFLEKHTAEEIFNHEYIQSILPLTWKDPSHRLCTYECQEMCGGGLHSAAWMASTNREEITR